MSLEERHVIATSLLRAHRVRGITPDELLGMFQALSRENHEDGDVIYHEGDRAENLHFLFKGTVRVSVGDQGRHLTSIRAPAVLGHLGVLTGLPRSASVVASEDVYMGRLSAREMWAMVESDSTPGRALRRLLLASLSQLVGQSNARLSDLAPLHGRLIASATPAAKRAPAVPKPKNQKGDDAIERMEGAFDAELRAQADDVEVIQSEADKRQRYKR